MGESILSPFAQTLTHIATEIGTPVYVYDADAIRRQFQVLTRALGEIPHGIYYSVKANSTLGVLDCIRRLGAGVDIVSGGELERVLRAGFPRDQIIYSGVGKSPGELQRALDAEIGMITIESTGELEVLERLTDGATKVANIGIRINPAVTTDSHPYIQTGHEGLKFGVPLSIVGDLTARIASRPSMRLRGIGMHLGSQITDPHSYRTGAERLAGVLEQIGAMSRGLKFVSVGGGLGIRYGSERPLEVDAFVEAIRPLWTTARVPIAVEPGRFLVGNAGFLLTTCLYRKQSGGNDFIVVDAGMNTFLRPSLYGTTHPVRTIATVDHSEVPVSGNPVHVVGPICESGDTFGMHQGLSGVISGDVLAVLGAGAYGFSMSSTYNSHPRPAEVLVQDGAWRVIRERETVDDLMWGEHGAGPSLRQRASGP